MGYINDTRMSQFIPISDFLLAGTCALTYGVAANLVSAARAASTTAFSIFVPIPLPSNDSALKGCFLESIDFYYKVGTSDLTSFTEPVLQKIALPAANATAPTGAAVTTTSTPSNATTLTQAEKKVTVTLTTPEWMDDEAAYYLDIEVDPAADTVVTLYGARANYHLRL